MNPEQAHNLVEKTFKHSFDRARFLQFAQELLNHLDISKQKRWSGNVSSKDAFKEKINHYERLGSYRDPNGEDIDVLVIHLKKEATLERGRTSLRNFAADYLTQRNKSAVLAAFVGKDVSDWRFSFVKLEYTTRQTEDGKVRDSKELTPARRYSFLVGSHEESHTAQKQFLSLLTNDQSDPTLREIEEAFDIEPVTKEFFTRYKDLFERVRDALDALLKKNKQTRDEFEKRGIETDDFAKKLLGQIVFLYFLQKKGWFGVKRGDEWGDGDKNYLRHLFDQRETYYGRGDKEPRRNFFNDILQPLFYNTLNAERTGDYSDRFRCKIPFLNGGLFEPLLGDNWFNIDILLPDDLFSNDVMTKDGDRGTGVLDVFDRYNFTVNEAEPLEREVAVDPEMLGKVFENLLPENLRHKGGAYYTPRVIVNYMCQQSLINYLATHLMDVPRADIETFMHIGYAQADYEAAGTKAHEKKFLPESISSNAGRIDRLLENITVCDPAIGSGAFPVGMMQEIVRARLALQKTGEVKERSAYDLKHHAIHNSLYGVDIDPGAVEIAKLRLWLSLVVDEEDRTRIQALPNLDYKIMQGNALLDEFAGVKLLDDKMFEMPASNVAVERAAIQARIRELQDQLYALHKQGNEASVLKKEFSKETDRLVKQSRELDRAKPAEARSLLDDPYSEARSTLEDIRRAIDDFFSLSSPQAKKAKRAKIEELEWRFMEQTLTARGEQKALREFEQHRRDNRKPYFLWKLYFADVFTAKGGFDVVIGNPPYGADLTVQEKDIYKTKYNDVHIRTPDTFNYFISKSLRILETEGRGLLCFIVPNNLLFQNEYTKTRKLLLEEHHIMKVLNLGDEVFESAVVPSCVFLVMKHPLSEYDYEYADLRNQKQKLSDEEFSLSFIALNKIDTLQTPSHVFGVDKAASDFIKRIEKLSVRIDDIADEVASGISTGGDKVFRVPASFAKQNNFEDKLLHKVLKGREINKYVLEDTQHLLIYTHKRVEIEKYPNIYNYLKPSKEQLSGKRETRQGKLPWWCLHWHRYPELFEGDKILIRQTSDELIATFDSSSYYVLNSLLVLKLKADSTYRLKFVLAILNSTLCNYIYKQITQEEGRTFAEVKPQNIRKLYIPKSISKKEQCGIETFVDYILFLKSDASGADSFDALMLSYFEQIINALVYELYLPDELHEAGRTFFEPLASEKLPALADIKGDTLAHLRRIFERLFDREHPIRQNIFFLDTLESVRIIEGKA